MAQQRYTKTAMLLHWLIALCLLGQWLLGYLLDDIAPKGTPLRAASINLHKSTGIVLGVLIVLRLLWRLGHKPPPWPITMPRAQQLLAHLGHMALYLCMLVVPTAGYLASNLSKHGIAFFGHPLAAWGPDWPQAYKVLNTVHNVAAWTLAVLVLGHIAFALKHTWLDKDGTLTRMLPASANS